MTKLLFKVSLIIVFLTGGLLGQERTIKCQFNLGDMSPKKTTLNGITLFVVDEMRYLEPRFDERCRLIQIDVADKGRWSDEDDKSLGLTFEEYRELKDRINKAYPIGERLDTDKIGDSSPRGTITWSRYEKALIESTSYESAIDGKLKGMFVSFKILFAHDVTGKLTRRTRFESSGFITKTKITVNSKSYWADEAVNSTPNINQSGTFRVFGGPVF